MTSDDHRIVPMTGPESRPDAGFSFSGTGRSRSLLQAARRAEKGPGVRWIDVGRDARANLTADDEEAQMEEGTPDAGS